MVRKSSPLKLESTKKRMQNVERMSYIGLWLAVLFFSIYILASVFDDLYNSKHDVTQSHLFVYNVIAFALAICLIITIYYDPTETGNGFYLKLGFSAALLVMVGLSSHEMRHLLDTSITGEDKEEATQFILSVIAVVFSFFGGAAIMINMLMRKYV